MPRQYNLIAMMLFCFMSLLAIVTPLQAVEKKQAQPNILWITSEDNGPHIGCYGDAYADTPHIDGLAKKGVMYLNCWSTAPVCAPARTTLITGMYPPSLGAEHMRCMIDLPKQIQMYPKYLRKAGYYCTNNSKEDYNVSKQGKVWDDSSRKAHWKNRKPGQPFFAIFNHTISHESKIRNKPHTLIHDPAKVRIPKYHPDTPEVRHDWAQYYDRITEMDAKVGQNLKELAAAGLTEETIIFYYGDHGSGMPRSKRWPYNSGLLVPLVVYVPPKFRHLMSKDYKANGQSDRLVGFVDFAPTLLSLAGIKPPENMQGNAFMGKHETKPQLYQFGFRGRMDERYDMVRSIRNKRFIYIRNFMPHKIYGQYLDYMFKTPTTQVWKKMYDAGELKPPQTYFWETKPAEELYDLEADPDEVNNLAGSKKHQKIRKELSQALQNHMIAIRDIGLLSEAETHARSKGMTPYEMGQNKKLYDVESTLKMAWVASSGKMTDQAELTSGLSHKDSAIRYWAAMGILMRGKPAVTASQKELRAALNDSSKTVRCIAAEALGRYGTTEDVTNSLHTLIELSDLNKHGIYIAMLALNGIDQLGDKAKPIRDQIAKLPQRNKQINRRMGNYINRLVGYITSKLDAKK